MQGVKHRRLKYPRRDGGMIALKTSVVGKEITNSTGEALTVHEMKSDER